MAADPISIVREDGFHWVVVNGEHTVGYASLTRAEAYMAGFRAAREGRGREAVYRHEVDPSRVGVDNRRMQVAWLEGWEHGRR